MAEAMNDESREDNIDMGGCIAGSTGTLIKHLRCKFAIARVCRSGDLLITFYTPTDAKPKENAIERVREFLRADGLPKWYLDREKVCW
jgi:hypothetical protein